MKTTNVQILTSKLMAELVDLGYSEASLQPMRALFGQLVHLHEQAGKEQFEPSILADYLGGIRKRYASGEISRAVYIKRERYLRMLSDFSATGTFNLSQQKSPVTTTNPYFADLLMEVSVCGRWSSATLSHVLTCARKLFAWLTQDGFQDLERLTAMDLQRYLLFCSEHMSGNGLRDIKYSLKQLFGYLQETDRTLNNFGKLLSFPVLIERKVKSALSQVETASILGVIGRSTAIGKRDYAILLLATVLGLRSIDIVRLQLTDIDWRNGEIRIIQSKTRKALALPLTADVGEAIQDYLLHSRAKSVAKEVFLRSIAPFRGFASKAAILSIYNSYFSKAGLTRAAFDGKSIHGLRRSVGLNMVTAGVPITTVAQALGHSDIDSTKPYIALDARHLRECALGFAGIVPKGVTV